MRSLGTCVAVVGGSMSVIAAGLLSAVIVHSTSSAGAVFFVAKVASLCSPYLPLLAVVCAVGVAVLVVGMTLLSADKESRLWLRIFSKFQEREVDRLQEARRRLRFERTPGGFPSPRQQRVRNQFDEAHLHLVEIQQALHRVDSSSED